ncbi:MAG TPA: hypothetical protein VJ991_05890 [Balneolales bacterium]|nr:hypothetical protein [Balneolales bacterium]
MNNIEFATIKKDDSKIDTLAQHIHGLIGNPVSVWAVAATIESIGIREKDVLQDFGYKSLYDLASEIYRILKNEKYRTSVIENNDSDFNESVLLDNIISFLKYYGLGLLVTIPLLSQIASLFIFDYSLWAWIHLNKAQATMIAIGVISSFIITGGFVQVIGREINRYIGMGDYGLAKKLTRQILLIGGITIICSQSCFYFLNMLFYFYPINMVTLSVIYGCLIGFMILLSSVLYTLEQIKSITIAVIIGTGLVVTGIKLMHLNMYIAQWMGLGATDLILVFYMRSYFSKMTHSNPKDTADILPQIEVIYYRNYRYFLYGILYFSFIFMDRIIAWSTGKPPTSFIIWFNTPYELGMDWALLGLIATVGVLEYDIHLFSERIQYFQKRATYDQIPKFNAYFMKLYKHQVLILIGMNIISVMAAYYAIHSLKPYGNEYPLIKDFFASPITSNVFWLASLGYIFFSIGLLHTLYCFTLARPGYVVFSLLISLISNFSIGFIMSRLISPEYAITGLVTGSVVFALLTGWYITKSFHRMDYFYFSAY